MLSLATTAAGNVVHLGAARVACCLQILLNPAPLVDFAASLRTMSSKRN